MRLLTGPEKVAAVVLVAVGLGGVGGGVGLLASTDGSALGLQLTLLQHTPFASYAGPGLMLLLINGVAPLVIAPLVVGRSAGAAWLVALQGLVLCGWIVVQVALLRFLFPPMHLGSLAAGLALLVVGVAMARPPSVADVPSWVLLFSRPLIFLVPQLLFSLVVVNADGTTALTPWWLALVVVVNLLLLWALSRLRRGENGLRSLWRFGSEWKRDLTWLAGLFVVAGPIGFFPGQWLARAFWDSPSEGNRLLFLPLPGWALVGLMVAFPLTQALVELPLYFGHVGARLSRGGWPRWVSVGVPALVLSLQHAAMPLVLDWRFATWRGLMFFPFAVLCGGAVSRRPSLLPWLMVLHALMDAQVPLLNWLVSIRAMTL